MEFLKERIINIRITFVCFAGLIAGVLFCYFFLMSSFKFLSAILFAVILVLLVIACYFYAIATEKHNKKHYARKDVSKLIKISCISFIVAFIVGLGIMVTPVTRIVSIKNYSNEVVVSGVVSDYVVDKSTYKKFIISDCAIYDNEDSENTPFKVVVYTSQVADINLGDKITFISKIDKCMLQNKDDFTKLIQGIGYTTYVGLDKISSVNGKVQLKDIVKSEARSVLDDNLSEDNANISYGVLFGEKQGLNEDITQAFSYAGISHILAVSGLHIGVLFVLIYKLLKKIKVNDWIRFVLLAIVLGFYAYLCDFTPSVSRASIMAMLVALCDIFAIEYDGISSLSIAGIIILLIRPMYLFTISFQLSFLCIFSIIALAPFLTNVFKKIKLPEFLASGLAISIATNLVIMPICLNVFDKVSLLGVITNILILPIFSIAYVLLFVTVLIAVVFNFMGFILVIPDLFLHIIKTIASMTAELSFGIFKAFNISYMALFIVVVTCLVLHFLMIKKLHKSIVCGVLLTLIVGFIISGIVPKKYDSNNVIIHYSASDRVVFYIKDNNVTMIGSDIEYFRLARKMKDMGISKIDNIIAYDLELNSLQNTLEIKENFNVSKIYIHDSLKDLEISNIIGDVNYYSNNIKIEDLSLQLFDENNKSFYMEVEEIGKILNINNEDVVINNELNLIYRDIDYLIIPNMLDGNILDSFNATKIICNDYIETDRDDLVNLKSCGKIILSGV